MERSLNQIRGSESPSRPHLGACPGVFIRGQVAECGSVAEWLGRWTCGQQVASSNSGLSAIECNCGQVVNTHVPLSPSSIIWYQPMGGDALRLER